MQPGTFPSELLSCINGRIHRHGLLGRTISFIQVFGRGLISIDEAASALNYLPTEQDVADLSKVAPMVQGVTGADGSEILIPIFPLSGNDFLEYFHSNRNHVSAWLDPPSRRKRMKAWLSKRMSLGWLVVAYDTSKDKPAWPNCADIDNPTIAEALTILALVRYCRPELMGPGPNLLICSQYFVTNDPIAIEISQDGLPARIAPFSELSSNVSHRAINVRRRFNTVTK
ncbi:MAG: hypothetical protein ACR2HJ_05270 [Fimbriimonadales bacterium]